MIFNSVFLYSDGSWKFNDNISGRPWSTWKKCLRFNITREAESEDAPEDLQASFVTGQFRDQRVNVRRYLGFKLLSWLCLIMWDGCQYYFLLQQVPDSWVTYRHDYRHGNMENFKNDMANFLESDPSNHPAESNWQSFKSAITAAAEKHIPQKIVRSFRKTPWFTRNLRRMIKKKQRLHNHGKKSGSTVA